MIRNPMSVPIPEGTESMVEIMEKYGTLDRRIADSGPHKTTEYILRPTVMNGYPATGFAHVKPKIGLTVLFEAFKEDMWNEVLDVKEGIPSRFL